MIIQNNGIGYWPYLLWVYREVPNATTGVSPYTLVYGRKANGPLSVLQEHWSGNLPEPVGLAKPISKYLQELKQRLETAAENAGLHAELQQAAYAHRYNLRARSKEFQVGDKVVVLMPDSPNKILAKWMGPADIVGRRSRHSYNVKLPNGSIRHVHVNKIRKFHTRVNTLGVIFEDDGDFGRIDTMPVQQNYPTTDLKTRVKNDGDLNETQQRQIRNLIECKGEFFAKRLGNVSFVKHEIKLKPGEVMKKPPSYRIPETLRNMVEDQVQELLQAGAIERANVERAHPVVCVAKKGGDMRMCVDFRCLNAITQDNAYPLCNQTELIRKIAKANYISVVDLYRGYWQILMDPGSRHLTAFSTPSGTYIWKVMPFGLKCAGMTFQKSINWALEAHRDYAVAYIDDIAIFSETWEQHVEHVEKVIDALNRLGYAGNLEKSQFGKRKVLYLGHLIGSGAISPDPEKLKVISNMKRPETKRQLRSILGLFNYYRDHIDHYAQIATPLTRLTSRKTPAKLEWGDNEEVAFSTLKKRLGEAATLFTPEYDRPFILDCDASAVAVGCVLSQEDAKGKERPIAFVSGKFTPAQQRWSTIEKEAFAIIYGLKKFEHYLFGTPVTVR